MVQIHTAENNALKSKFTGTLLELAALMILQIIVFYITLGIGYPWVICMKERWLAKNTVIDGKRLVFVGKGANLFAQYIKWFLLCIITLGIYTFWLNIKVRQWIVENTHFVENV